MGGILYEKLLETSVVDPGFVMQRVRTCSKSLYPFCTPRKSPKMAAIHLKVPQLRAEKKSPFSLVSKSPTVLYHYASVPVGVFDNHPLAMKTRQ